MSPRKSEPGDQNVAIPSRNANDGYPLALQSRFDRAMTQRDSLFTSIVPPESQHQLFRAITSHPGHLPSREGLQAAYELFPSPDGNFIKDFQSTGFDARIWELYLSALFPSLGITVSQPSDRPDFHLTRDDEIVWVEATTANATQGSVQSQPEGYWEEIEHVAAKLGSALFSKLNKRYWELPHVSGKPLVLAVADFHDPDPLRQNVGPISRYLYGKHSKLVSPIGEPVRSELLEVKSLGPKKVPAGFFNLPDAKYISAVLFSNAGTAAKFSRMAFDNDRHPFVRMLRHGFSYNKESSAVAPEPFAYIVGSAPETWGQEVVVMHNPSALHPVSQAFFEPLCQQWFIEDDFRYKMPSFLPIMSRTIIVSGHPKNMQAVETHLLALGRKWVLGTWDRMPELESNIRNSHQEWQAQDKAPGS